VSVFFKNSLTTSSSYVALQRKDAHEGFVDWWQNSINQILKKEEGKRNLHL